MRKYLITPNTFRVSYDVELDLQKSLKQRDDHYTGKYQVLNFGKEINFLGSEEQTVPNPE